jgi:hypothetical protein
MIHEVMAPCVQDTDKSNLAAQMLGISGKFKKSLRNTTKKNIIEDSLIPQSKRIEFCGNGKYNMEIGHGKKVFFPLLKPFFFFKELALGAMPVSARVIRYPRTATGAAFIHMTSQLCGSASFNSSHGAELIEWHFMSLSVRGTVLAEDIGHLYTTGPSHFKSVEVRSCC